MSARLCPEFSVSQEVALATYSKRLVARYTRVCSNCALHMTAGPIDATIGDKEIDTNFRSVIVATATVLPHLKTQPSACLINVSSGLYVHCASDKPVTKSYPGQEHDSSQGRTVTAPVSPHLLLTFRPGPALCLCLWRRSTMPEIGPP